MFPDMLSGPPEGYCNLLQSSGASPFRVLRKAGYASDFHSFRVPPMLSVYDYA